MLFRGYFLAITDDHVRDLRKQRGDPARRAYAARLEEEIDDAESTDKAWYIILHCFMSSRVDKATPDLSVADLATLELLFIGGQSFHRADFYVINLISKQRVTDVADALGRVSQTQFSQRYHNVKPGCFHAGDYLGSQEQCSYCWGWLERIAGFFDTQRSTAKHILFTSQFQ